MSNASIITNVCLVDGINPPAAADIVIEDGRFTTSAPPESIDAPGYRHLDGEGMFLVPGLWESHTHLMMGVDGSLEDKVAGVKKGLQSYLSRGVTSVVDLGCAVDVMHVARVEMAEQPSGYPGFHFAGPVFTGVNGWPLCMTCDHTSSWEITPDSPVEAMVADLNGKTDIIKIIYDGLPGGSDKFPRSALDRVVRAAHANGKRVMIHVRSKSDVVEAVDAGADCIEHIFQPEAPESLDEAHEAAELMGRHNVFWCPTLTTYEQIAHLGSLGYLEDLRKDGIITVAEMALTELNPFFHHRFPRVSAEEAQARLDYGLATLRIFADAGVRIVAGSDIAIAMSRPAAVLRELQLFARGGLDPAAVIRSVTVDAAVRLGLPAETVGFSEGTCADAILLHDNPLASIDALVRPEGIAAVFRSGVLVVGD